MEQTAKKQHMDNLFALIASIDDPEDCRALFDDLCTVRNWKTWRSGSTPQSCF